MRRIRPTPSAKSGCGLWCWSGVGRVLFEPAKDPTICGGSLSAPEDFPPQVCPHWKGNAACFVCRSRPMPGDAIRNRTPPKCGCSASLGQSNKPDRCIGGMRIFRLDWRRANSSRRSTTRRQRSRRIKRIPAAAGSVHAPQMKSDLAHSVASMPILKREFTSQNAGMERPLVARTNSCLALFLLVQNGFPNAPDICDFLHASRQDEFVGGLNPTPSSGRRLSNSPFFCQRK